MHNHDHTHENSHDHPHKHEYQNIQSHRHECPDSQNRHPGIQGGLMQSKAEAAAFMQYTLSHNAHHAEEMNSLACSLEHMNFVKEAEEIRMCIEDMKRADSRLKAVLNALK